MKYSIDRLKKKESYRLVNFRVTENEYAEIMVLAKEYATGNMSALVRDAIATYKPKKKLRRE